MQKRYDTIIVGGGIAGLACARRLLNDGKKVLVLEARPRVGGRIYTRHDPLTESPIELGAEFIHDAPQTILKELEAGGILFHDVVDTHFYVTAKDHDSVDFWDRMEKVQKKLSATRKKDRSIKEFADAQRSLNPQTKAMFLAFMEGFQAADTEKLSEKVIALAAKEGGEVIDDVNLFRPTKGYQGLVDRFVHVLQAYPESLRLNTVVKKIKWKKNHVKVHCHHANNESEIIFEAKQIVVTLPIGVLKQKTIEWDPYPANLESGLSGFDMGAVERISFLFRSRFWEDLLEKKLSFIHAGPDVLFPTWWSQSPVHSPLLVAWQGGPKAKELSRLPIEKRVDIALQTLSTLLKIPLYQVHSELLRWYAHDWNNDPYSYGAYSYVVKDGVPSVAKMKKPQEGTIFFAGEALASHNNRGTVHGAIDTGDYAAEIIIKGA